MITIAILADIHGNLLALQAVLHDLKHRHVDTVVNLGDHVSGPLWPRETIDLLMKQPWLHIAGNHDRQIVHHDPATHGASDRYAYERLDPDHLAWLRALPATLQLTPDVLLCHGTPSSDERYLLETIEYGTLRQSHPSEIEQRLTGVDARLIACGHSHLPRLVRYSDSLLIVNPGSVGNHGYEDPEGESHIVETGATHARYALLEQQGDEWLVELIAVPYDHLSAARQAERNGRPDWEISLRTGFMRA